MSLFTKMNTKLGIEDAEVEINIENPVDEDGTPVDTAEATDTVVADVVADADEIEEGADDVEVMGEDVESLESLKLKIVGALADGGISAQSAGFLQTAVENICARYGDKDGAGIPSFESFGARETRQVSTEASLANVTNKIREFWAQIVRVIKATFDKLAAWFKKVTSSAGSLVKKAEAIKKQAGSLKGKTAEAKTVKVGSVRNISIGGKVLDVGGLEKAMGELAGDMPKVLTPKYLGKPSFADMVADFDGEAEEVEIPGNVRVVLGGAHAGVHASGAVGAGGESSELATLSIEQIVALADKAGALAKAVEKGEQNYSKMAAAKDKIMKMIDAEVARAGKDGADASKTREDAVKARKILTAVASTNSATVKSAVGCAATALQWAQASINAYAEPAAK